MTSGGDDKAFSVYQVADRAVFAGLQDGEGVIVDTQSSAYFGLNKTAAYLWEVLQKDKEVTVAHLVDVLCARFDVSRDAATSDVESFLRHVVEYGLAKRREIPVNE